MKKFYHPMNKFETVSGFIFLALYIFLLPDAVALLTAYILPAVDIVLNEAQATLIFYVISFVIVLFLLHGFYKNSFYSLMDNKMLALRTLVLAYAGYYVMLYAVQIIVSLFVTEISNPNTQQVDAQAQLNRNVMTAVAVFLAPVVEEGLFRGVVFGTIRKKSRIAAYIVSFLAFAVYHLLDYFIFDFSFSLFIYLLQYLPASIALAWCYEESRSIWTPICMHALINWLSISISVR